MNDQFGRGVAISGDKIAVGAPESEAAPSAARAEGINGSRLSQPTAANQGALFVFIDQPSLPLQVTTLADTDDGICDATNCTLREAIAKANENPSADTIRFAPGLVGIIQLTGALPTLSSNIVLEGPGADLLTVRRNTGGDYRILRISNGTASGPVVSVSGLTLANGNASGPFPSNAGGGILNDHGNLTLKRVTLSGNVCASPCNGGGIYNYGANGGNAQLAVSDSTLSNNNGGLAGGGIYNDGANGGSANLSVTNTTFYFNAAGAGGGGGILNTADSGGVANATVTNCTFADNFGGIRENSAGAFSVILRNTIFKSSFGSSLSGNAGAIVSQGHNLSSDAAGGDGGTGPGGLLNGPGDKRNTNPQLDPAGPANNGGPTMTVALLSGSPAINMGDDALGLHARSTRLCACGSERHRRLRV